MAKANTEKRPLKTEPKFGITPNTEQKEVIRKFYENDINFVLGEAGSGKTLIACYLALKEFREKKIDKIWITRPIIKNNLGILPGPQPLWSKVLTPFGWSTIGELKIGDEVSCKDGTSQKILNKSRISNEDFYKVTTSDNKVTYCGINHLFLTQTINDIKHYKNKKYGHKYQGSVKSLKEIINTFEDKYGKKNHYLPFNEPIVFNNIKSHFIDPYVMGCLLGDGSLGESIVISKPDLELIEKCKTLLERKGFKLNFYGGINHYISDTYSLNNKVSDIYFSEKDGFKIEHSSRRALELFTWLSSNQVCTYTNHKNTIKGFKITSVPNQNKYTNRIKNELDRLELMFKKSTNKFIPKEYIYNSSIEDRVELLRGLMDTDGTNDGSCAAFTTVSKQLAEDVVELVRSLGGRANIYSRNRIGKVSIFNDRNITSNFISYEVVINLLKINPFYLSRKAEKYNPKAIHNSRIVNIELIGKTEVQCLLLDSKEGLYITDDYIVTHNSIDEKLDPYIYPIKQNLYNLQGIEITEKMFERKEIEIIPIDVAKGLTFSKSVAVVDEVQDCVYSDFRTILTRVGKDSKIIFCASSEQIDKAIGTSSAYYSFRTLEESDLVGYTILQENHRNDKIIEILKYLEKK